MIIKSNNLNNQAMKQKKTKNKKNKNRERVYMIENDLQRLKQPINEMKDSRKKAVKNSTKMT